tara:strand:+ start:2067 stop:4967 length:2901 start_codon:yes stop_codon:yes gene_type:complete
MATNDSAPDQKEKSTPKALRQRAEEILGKTRTDVSKMEAKEVQQLVHELQVHQMELEIQNQELREAQMELSVARDRYADLYEFAPVSYVTLDKVSRILDANLAAATLLGTERRSLLGQNLADFIAAGSQDEWFLHKRAVFSSDSKQTCEVTINPSGDDPRTIYVKSIAVPTEPEPHCRTALIDISARKQAEDELAASERFSRDFLNNLFTFAGMLTPDGTVIEANEAPLEVAGIKMEDVYGKKFWDCFWWNYSKEVQDQLREICERAARGELIRCDLVARVAGDGRMPIDFQISPFFNDRGEITYLVPSAVDITERKQAEEELQKLNENLECEVEARTAELAAEHELNRGIIETAQAIIVLLDRKGRILRFNPFLEELCGRKQEDVQGKNWFETFVPKRDRKRVRAKFKSAIQGKPTRGNVNPIVTKTGEVRDIEWHDAELIDSAGEFTALLSIGHDVTERKLFESALSDKEQWLRSILASIPAHIAVLDHSGTIVTVNPAWEQFAAENGGDPLHCSTGVNYLEVCRKAAEQGCKQAAEVVTGLEAILSGSIRDCFTLEYPCHSPTQQRWFLLQATRLVQDHDGLVVSHTDITERVKAEHAMREREERLRTILNTAADAIITIDCDGIIVSVNPATETMLGYHADELVGQNVKILMPEPYHSEHDGYLKHYHETGEKHIIGIGREVPARRKDGSTFPVSLSVSEVDHLGLYTGILRDVTRQKRYEEELEQMVEERTLGLEEAQAELLKAERLATLGQLAAGVAHEMRTPLGVIRNAVHYLESTEDPTHDEEIPNLMGEMNRAISSTDHIISELLDYVREPVREYNTFPIRHAIERGLKLANPPENVAVTISGASSSPVWANPGQITRILINLLQNAVQAMPEGGRITLTVRQSNGMVCTEIRDTGDGITKENLQKVFDPLFTTKTRGIGLGLAISRRYAELNGGKLEVESKEGTGTVFRLTLKTAP